LEEICALFREKQAPLLITRLTPERMKSLALSFDLNGTLKTSREGATLSWWPEQLEPKPLAGRVALVSAGASDEAVLEEAEMTLNFFGASSFRVCDAGVAGIHRLLKHEERLKEADVCIVAAGMDGALPSVVGGLLGCPVFAVPTSVGYGSAFGGVSALLSMLNSCASGVAVSNIDNGYGAAMSVIRILKMISAKSS
jgi:NCAIR mutase (PurE)-related protein